MAPNIKLFADGADIDGIKEMAANSDIKGFTTNPTLMKRAGVSDYEAFAKKVLKIVKDRPVSFEVFADDFETMAKQAYKIASWSANVNVKIPITNTKGESAVPLIKELSNAGVVVNVTAIMTVEQVRDVADVLNADTSAIISVFAGRIADTGIDPVPVMKKCKETLALKPKAELLWASPRELLNVFHAEESGADIITATNDILKKLESVGKDLNDFSRETVEMFYKDASAAGYTIEV